VLRWPHPANPNRVGGDSLLSAGHVYLHKLVRAKERTGLPYGGLLLYYTMVYLQAFRWLRPARRIGELLQRLFNSNRSVNLALADVYRQIWHFAAECEALMRIVPANRHDIELLAHAGETSAYARDLCSLERLRDIAAEESPALLFYLDGLLSFLKGHTNYQAQFMESVKCFLDIEGADSSDRTGDLVSSLMKKAIKSGHHIPEFVRVAYNIRDLASIDELLVVDGPFCTVTPPPAVVGGTTVSGGGRRDPIVLISCSWGYLDVFGDYYIRTFRRKNANIIHFHVLADDLETTREYLVALQRRHANVCFSIEPILGESQTYITLARFLICRDLMESYNSDVLISDIDFRADFDLGSIDRELRSQGYDFGLCDAGYSVPWGKFSVGFSYFRFGNYATSVYLDLLSRYLVSLYSDGGFFSLDQSGALLIYEYMQARGDEFEVLNLYRLIDFRGLFNVPRELQRGKIRCKFGDGAPI
jgi:hypothetical protein